MVSLESNVYGNKTLPPRVAATRLLGATVSNEAISGTVVSSMDKTYLISARHVQARMSGMSMRS